MVELRQPPQASQSSSSSALVPLVVVLQVLVLLGVGWLLFVGSNGDAQSDDLRSLAGKLSSAGALGEAASVLERYLDDPGVPAEERSNVAFTIAKNRMEEGELDRALRWFYVAEEGASGSLREEVGRKIVQTLERLGRAHAAQAALAERSRLPTGDSAQYPDSDPVVARIDQREIRKSELDRFLDAAGSPGALQPQQLAQALEQYVAAELLWRKAQKLEYDKDPQVLRQFEQLAQQLAISKMVEGEILTDVEVDPTDLETYFQANRDRYVEMAREQNPDAAESLTLEAVRPFVEQEYAQSKAQSAYQRMVETEMSTASVELFPERLSPDSQSAQSPNTQGPNPQSSPNPQSPGRAPGAGSQE